MLKKSLLFVLMIGCTSQSVVFASDVPVVAMGDSDTIAHNIGEIGHNLYDIGRNTARIAVRACVNGTSGLAKFTKFCSEHPGFTVCLGMLTGYGYYKWRKVCQRTRDRLNRDDFTLVDVWRTTREHWQRRN